MVVIVVEVVLNCGNQAMTTIDEGGTWMARGSAASTARKLQKREAGSKGLRIAAAIEDEQHVGGKER